ncbi:MAG TPA: hypothetical protein VNK41_04220 [Vicinamibacterales bacterium]|nr:hypothetical protein [Vicinamibacterales bacterium]
MINSRRCHPIVLSLLVLSAACGSQSDGPPVAEPAAQFSRTEIALGSPVDVTYRFKVAADARFDQDYHVMVHFLDSEGELMWTDDHLPPTPTSKWRPGQEISYTRTMFVPIVPYIGETTVNMGLYSVKDKRRLPLSGETTGHHAYKVATVELLPQTGNVFLVFKNGWHETEVAPQNPAVEWQWTKKTATLTFRNPRRDSTFYLHVDNPGSGGFSESQKIDILVNGQPVDSFKLAPGQEVIHRAPISASVLGDGDMAELAIQVDKTFVPALLPAANSRDSRELGVRVFHMFVEPRT